MDPLATAVQLSIGLVTIAAASLGVAAMIRSRSLPPNGAIGIRTRATRRSAESWYAGHDAARPGLLTAAAVSGLAVAVTLGAGVVLRSAGDSDAVVVTVGLAGYVVVVAVLVHATIQANRAAAAVVPPGQ